MGKFKLTQEEIIDITIDHNIDLFKESFNDKKIILQKMGKTIIGYNYYFFKLIKIPKIRYIDGYYLYISNSIIDKKLKFKVWEEDSTAFDDFDFSGTILEGKIKHKDIIKYLKRI